jgi:hypothetical protein
MQRMAAQKRKERLHNLAEANKLLVPAGFPRLSRDYRLGMPDGELELLPDPKSRAHRGIEKQRLGLLDAVRCAKFREQARA